MSEDLSEEYCIARDHFMTELYPQAAQYLSRSAVHFSEIDDIDQAIDVGTFALRMAGTIALGILRDEEFMRERAKLAGCVHRLADMRRVIFNEPSVQVIDDIFAEKE